MKRIILLALCLCMLLAFTACSSEPHIKEFDWEQTESTEDSKPSAPPYQTTRDEIQKKLGGTFMFGSSVLYTPVYTYYPDEEIAEMQFIYQGTRFYARACRGEADISCWNHDWIKPYAKCTELSGLSGDMRKVKVNGVQYTSIIWYDETRDFTFTLNWTGGGEYYLDVTATVFNYEKESDAIIPLE